jgi:transposase
MSIGAPFHPEARPSRSSSISWQIAAMARLLRFQPSDNQPMAHWLSVLTKVFADGGYQGNHFRQHIAKLMPTMSIEIVKRSDQTKGFAVLPKRWLVERTLAWLNRCRRLAKDFENLNRTALTFLRLASIRLMLRKLCNPR